MQHSVEHQKSKLLSERPTVIMPLSIGLFDRNDDIATGLVLIRERHDVRRFRDSHELIVQASEVFVTGQRNRYRPARFVTLALKGETAELSELYCEF